MKIITKNLFHLTNLEIKKLKKLTLDDEESGMNIALKLKNDDSYKKIYNFCKILIFSNQNEWIGWCLARESKLNKKNSYMIYIEKDFRRKGYGKFLIEKAIFDLKKRNKFINVCYVWDYDSQCFYQSPDLSKKLIKHSYDPNNPLEV